MTCSKCGNEVDGSLENNSIPDVVCERCNLLIPTSPMWETLSGLLGNNDGSKFFQSRYGGDSNYYGSSSRNESSQL